MRVILQAKISDPHLDGSVTSSQRQVEISIAAEAEQVQVNAAPLNLCLVLDHSGSMSGRPMETVKQAAINIVDKLTPNDRISVVAFDHKAKIIVPNQTVENIAEIKEQIQKLQPAGGTCIDDGMKLGLQESALGKKDRISQIFLLTDGENEHGDNQRCLKIAQLAPEYNLTINTLGFGAHWNQDILEQIADSAGGTLSYIEKPEQAVAEFAKLFTRIQSVGLTNAYLLLDLIPEIRLAELKPIAQVAPETVELSHTLEQSLYCIRLGDLMIDNSRQILVNLYISQLSPGLHQAGSVSVRYDDPATGQVGLLSETIPLEIEVQKNYQAEPDPQVHKSILTLAKYRQTQLAETKLQQGDKVGAATLLKTAAKTALQLGDKKAATVLESSATRLQEGDELSPEDRKKTRLASKTKLDS